MASPDTSNDQVPPPARRTLLIMLVTLGDTTWRMFMPTLAGVIGGIWLDKNFQTTPLFTILGVLLGTTLAFMLVYMQIRGVKK